MCIENLGKVNHAINTLLQSYWDKFAKFWVKWCKTGLKWGKLG